MIQPYLDSALIIFIYVVVWFIAAQIQKDNSIIDIAWGLGFVLVSWWMWALYPNSERLLVSTLVTIWGGRLALYLFFRNRNKGEDWRYAKWRKQWGEKAMSKAFIRVFLLQGTVMWLIALPLMGNQNVEVHPIIKLAGLLLASLGFIWESVSDWQLFRFKQKAQNKGKVMKNGLWSFSRHPNYFGEICFWWGIFLITSAYNNILLSVISPVLITFLLIKVSGVAMLERRYSTNEEYANYIQSTNALIPRLSTIFASLFKYL